MGRSFTLSPLAVAATTLFAACVDLTPRWEGRKDAGDSGGSAASDAATGGGGGTVPVGPDADAASGGARAGGATTTAGTTTGGTATGGAGGLLATGGTGGTATGGAARNVALDAGAVADASGGGEIDVPFSVDTSLPVDRGTGGASTGGTGGTGTGGASTGGTAAGGAGGSVVVDAGVVADTPQDRGIDVPSDLGTGGSGGAGTGGRGGAGTGGTATGGATAPMVISIRFVGGVAGGSPGTVAMAATESAGVKPATHWNSAASNAGTLSALVAADGTTTSAAVTWNSSATYTVPFTDTSGDAHMMNGYLDPRASASPATVNVIGLPSSMSSGYDVYVYCYAGIGAPATDTRTARYTIGSTTHTMTQTGPSVSTFSGYTLAPEGGAGNYVAFRNVTGTSFTLTAQPAGSTATPAVLRAPVNGIQIVYPSGS